MKLISKSKFLDYLTCPKDAWFRMHKPELKEFEVSSGLQNTFDQGYEAEEYAKNFQNKEASALRIEYKNSEGFITTYYPDFFVKKDNKNVYIIETKGREEENDKLKFERLEKWCVDVNNRQDRVVYKPLYIKQEAWNKDRLKNFDEVVRMFSAV